MRFLGVRPIHMATTTYTLCTLQRGDVYHKAWVPSKLAIKGKSVKIGDFRWGIISTGAVVPKDKLREKFASSFGEVTP